MPQAWARPVALGVIRVGDEILVFRGHDRVKDETYYRPLGGTIEFGEHSEAAVRRELREELGVTVVAAHLLGVIENRFVVNGQPGHELDFVYLVSVDELARLRSGPIAATEADGSPLACLWMPLAAFRSGERLYPPGLLEWLS
jgi:8-oxo-dGTP pyrophosphatase MutT (NUDIX family)